ncbi:MAG TPA: hypothetical protein P5534_19465, partial [Candidatus Paceibacterota bacterium]|nr:hypothetical protein [Candidatus Paceibacterota bacterium]
VKPGNTEVLVYPTYSRSAWGYGVKLKVTGKLCALPLVPKGIVGTKRDALEEAMGIRDWLKKNSTAGQITMSGWGDIDDIQPGTEYIR